MRYSNSENVLILTAGAVVISLAAILNVSGRLNEKAPARETGNLQEMRESLTQLEHRIETLENLDPNRPRTGSEFQWTKPAGPVRVTQMTP